MKPYFVSFFILCLTLLGKFSYGQNTIAEKDSIYTYESIEVKPTLIKGMPFLYKQLATTLTVPKGTNIPEGCLKITISFIVFMDGTVGGYEILKGKEYGLKDNILQAFKELDQDWVVGRHHKKTVNTRMSLPIIIKLNH